MESDAFELKNLPDAIFNQGYYKKFFKQGRKLGRGAGGSVYLCQHVIDDVMLGEYAIKILPIGDDKGWLVKHLKEVHVLERLRHPNIIDYKHTWIELHKPTKFGPVVPCLFLLMEYANGGNLEEYVTLEVIEEDAGGSRAQGPVKSFLEEAEILRLFLAIAKGLNQLHSLGIIHRDMKPGNLLLHYPRNCVTDPIVLISDFGECYEAGQGLHSLRTGATGTIEFMAPELFETNDIGEFLLSHSSQTDIWSLGMILYYLYFGGLPYQNIDDIELLRDEMLSFDSIQIPTQIRPITMPMVELLKHILTRDSDKRPLLHDIIRGVEVVLRIKDGPPISEFISPQLRTIKSDTDLSRSTPEYKYVGTTAAASQMRLFNVVPHLSLAILAYLSLKCYPYMPSVPVITLIILHVFAAKAHGTSSFLLLVDFSFLISSFFIKFCSC